MPRPAPKPLSRVLTALLVAAFPITGCSASFDGGDDGKPGIAASGSGNARSWPVADFTAVGLGTAGDVEIHTGQRYSLSATGPSEALDTLKVVRDGPVLKLERRAGVHSDRGGRIHFVVTMPAITQADIGGSGSMTIDRVDGDAFAGDIGGSGDLVVSAMAVEKASFAIGGSGDVKAAGRVRALTISIGGSGKFLLQPLTAETAHVTISGSGDVRATVRRTADVTIAGAGDVTIGGGAACRITRAGSGSVHCG